MKNKLQSWLVLLGFLTGSLSASAQDTAFVYQGQLQNSGSPANGFFDLQFSLFNAPSAGSQVGGTVTNLAVGVSNGLFNATLDFGAVLNGEQLWLAISVRSNGVGSYVGLTPLQPITPVPYAIFANTASNLSGQLPASQLSGTVPVAQLPGVVLTNNQGGVNLNGLTTVSNLAVTGTNFVNNLMVSNAPALDGSAITGLNASRLASGTVPLAQLSGLTSNQLDAATWQLATNLNGGNAALASNVVSGIKLTNAFLTNALITNSVFAGDGSSLTNLNAAQLSSGTIPLAQLPGVVLTNNQSGVNLNGLTTVSNLAVTGTNFVNNLVVSNAPTLDGSAITGLNASQLASGTVPLAQLSGITSNQLDAATWQLATNLNGGNAALASNVVSGISLTNAYLTNALLTNSVFAGDGSSLTNLNAAQLNSGTLPLTQLPGVVLTNNQSGASLNGLTTVSNLAVTGTNFVNNLVVSNAPTLDGSAITGLNASQLASGTVPLAQLSGITSNQLDAATWQLATNLNGGNAALASNVVSGIKLTNAFLTNALITNSVFAGDGSSLTNLNAAQLSSGTLPLTQLPGVVLTNNQSGASLNGLTTVSNLAVTGTNFVNNLVVSNAPALDGSAITGLNASQLASGTVPLAQLSGLTSNQLDAATWQLATNLNGGNAALASNVVSGINLTNAFLTNALITNSVFAGDGSSLTNLNAAQLNSGTIPLPQLPGIVLTNTQSGVTLNGLTTVSNLAVTGTNFVNNLVVSNAPALNGSAITGLNASQLASGTVPLAQLSSITSNQLDAATWQLATNLNGGNAALASNVVSGINLTNAYLTNALLTNSVFAGDGSSLTNLNAAQLNSGTVPLAQLPAVVLTNNQSGASLNGLTTVSNLAVTGTNFVNNLVVGNAPALNGSAITGLNASQLASGTVPLAQLSGITSNQLDAATWQLATNLNGGNAALASNVVSGISLTNAYLTNALLTNSVFAGDGSSLTNLNAAQLSSGTVPLAQLPAVVLTNNQSGASLNGLTTVSNLAVTGTNFVNNLVVSNAPALDGSAITGLNASQLASGTVPLAQLSGLTSNQLDAATWQLATNLNGGNAALASNVVSGLNLTNAFLTNALLTNSVFAGDGSSLTNLNAAQLSSGTIPLAQLPGVVLTNNQSGVSLNGLTTASNLAVTGTNFVNNLVVSNAPALDGSAITGLNASQLASGTVPLAQLSGLTSNQLDAATWQLATNLNGGNAALASNVVSGINLTNAYLTNALITNSVFTGDGSGLANVNVSNLIGVMTGNVSLSNTYGMTNVFDGDSYTRGDGSLPYSMPLGVQQMSGIPSVNYGFDGFTTYQILTNFQSNTWAWHQPNVIWAGNNDQYAFTPIAQVVSNIGVMVADMALSNNTRYLVLSTINDYTNQGIGTPVYDYFTNLNAALQSTFTNHYIDLLAWMVQNYNPSSPADLYGFTNDSPPVSEWNIPVDHPNALGEALIANKVLENAYWLNSSAPLTTASVQEQIQNALSQPVIFGNAITVTNIFPAALNPVAFTDPLGGDSMYLSPYYEQIWTSTGTLGFNGINLNNIGALTAGLLTAEIDTSTNASGFPPLFSASASPNDGGALTNLNASQLAGGMVPSAQLPVATASTVGVVQPDGSSITINHGVISLGATIYITNAMVDGTPLNVTYAHGLGTFPGFVHPILLCTTNDAGTGMMAGQMTEFSSVTGQFEPVFASVSYDTTNIYIQTTGRTANAGGYQFFPSQNDLRPTSWNNFAIVVGFHQ